MVDKVLLRRHGTAQDVQSRLHSCSRSLMFWMADAVRQAGGVAAAAAGHGLLKTLRQHRSLHRHRSLQMTRAHLRVTGEATYILG